MASTNIGPSVTTTPNAVAGAFDPSNVAITGGVIGGVQVVALSGATNLDVAYVGDSRVLNNWSSSTVHTSQGVSYWAEVLSTVGARHPYEYNFGTSGFTSAQVLATHIPAAAACAASTVVYFASTNDRVALTLDQTIANVKASIAPLLAVGKNVILVAETPRATPFVLTGDQLAYHVAFREWCKDFSALYPTRVSVVDVWPLWIDSTASPSSQATGKSYDGLHPGPIGAYDIGAAIAAAHNRLFSGMDWRAATQGGGFTTASQRGNLLSNGALVGTGGAVTGSPAPTGSVASFCTLDSLGATGLTITASKVTVNGLEYQQIAITGTPTTVTPSVQIRQSVGTPANIAAGDVIESFAEIAMDAGQTGVQGLRLTNTFADSNGTTTVHSGERFVSSGYPAIALSGAIARSPRYVAGSSCSSASQSLNVMLTQNVAASVVVRTRGWNMRKVIAA